MRMHVSSKRPFLHWCSSIRSQSSSSLSSSSSFVKIVEVGPRDGLQNESSSSMISTENKISLIKRLGQTGLRHIEVGSFVSPKWVPQMKDTKQVLDGLSVTQTQTAAPIEQQQQQQQQQQQYYSCLIPNLKGMQEACQYQDKLHEVAIFASASETFSQKNINCSISESIERFRPVVALAKEPQNQTEQPQPPFRVRGYVSCVLGCPYEGRIPVDQVINVTHQLLDELHCDEVSLGDTIGVGTPLGTTRLLKELINAGIPPSKLAVHFHDTYGQGLVNLYASLEEGIRTVDTSIAGLGGCPYAAGSATGNVATEDVVYSLEEGTGMETGIDLEKLVDVSEFVWEIMGKCNSKVATAMMAKRRKRRQDVF